MRRSCASVNKVLLDAIRRGASDIHFEPYEKMFRVRYRMDGVLQGDRAAPGAADRQDRRAHQGHGAPRHRRAARAAGRAHQDAAVQEPRHRFSRQHLPDALRREDRDAYSRSLAGHARHRRARLRAVPEGALSQAPRQAAGHDPGDRARPAAARPFRSTPGSTSSIARTRTSRPPRTRRKSICPASTRSTSTTRSV